MRMKEFFSKFKYVKPIDICHIFLFLMALPIALVYRLFRKELWLICDNGREASDNGFHLFKYIKENHHECDCVFAVKRTSPDYSAVSAIGDTVEYGSFCHWILYLAARVNISSQKGGKPNYAVCNLLEVYGILRNNRVFLQHGIILTDIQFLYYKNTKMSMFVTSTKREYDYLTANYGYPEGAIKLLGLARFDALHGINANPNRLLIMPTWREWLGTQDLVGDSNKKRNEFLETDYFKRWNELLNSESFKEITEKRNLEVMFYLHREAQRFADCFNTNNPSVKICKYPEYKVDELLKSSAFMVTDYSSVQADFAYMKKPLAYYQFDYERFSDEHYGKGYFDYQKDGFGPSFDSLEPLIDYIDRSAEQGFKNEQKYLKRHSDFFTLYDTENCKRNFQAIKEKWSLK